MKKIIVFTLVCFALNVNAQNTKMDMNDIAQNNYRKGSMEDFSKHNYSDIFLKNQNAFLGYIGDNYQRLFVEFISIIKNPDKENEYFVYGKTKVKSNECEFNGLINIKEVMWCEDIIDPEAYDINSKLINKENPFYEKGYIVAQCTFYENMEEKGSGKFIGTIMSYFYINEGKILFDDLELQISDSYYNNQFSGVWKSYFTGSEKRCNWGLYRIPNSGDLDIGVGEFSANPKYKSKGW